MGSLQQKSPIEVEILEALSGKAKLEAPWSRLHQIFETREGFWRPVLDAIPEWRVKYLLIAEAPPGALCGNVQEPSVAVVGTACAVPKIAQDGHRFYLRNFFRKQFWVWLGA